MLFMSEQASQQEGNKKDWDRIIAQAAHTNPICTNWLQQLSLYVRKGPSSGEILSDLNKSSKVFKASDHGVKVIGEEFFTKLNTMSWGRFETFPLVENAFLKAQLAGDSVTDNVCRTIPPSALTYAKSEKMRQAVRAAERLMADVRAIVQHLASEPECIFQHVCMLDVRLALLITNRQNEFGMHFKDVDEIAQERMHASCARTCAYTHTRM